MLLKKAKIIIFNCLEFGFIGNSGRNCSGRMTIRHRGGGVSRLFRIIDFIKYVWNVRAALLSFQYDPNRTSLIAMLSYTNSIFSYALPTQGSFPGSVLANINVLPLNETRANYCANLNFIRPGVYVNSLELR